jgi:hypothetical protein
MRILKLIVLFVLLAVAGFFAYVFVIYPATWYSDTRRESVRILKAAQSTADLTNAVGYLGWYISLTNNAWIAIRYRDSHGGGVRSCAVARDSGGGWFESDRHFCGSLSYWPRLKEEVAAEEEQRKLTPDLFTNHVSRADSDNGMFPSYREMIAVESAPDLESARHALMKLGFRELRQ